MLVSLVCVIFLGGLAHADDGTNSWSDNPPEPKAWADDITAYTIPKGSMKLGLVSQEYGLLDNVSIGTKLAFLGLGVGNGHAKVTAIQTPKFDASLHGEVFNLNLEERLGITNGSLRVTPVGWTGSWVVSEKFSGHFGHNWVMANIEGQLSPADMAEAMQRVLGVNIDADLTSALGTDGGLYGGARLTLTEFHLALDFRLNRRDSIVLQSSTFVALQGLIAAGVSTATEGDASVELGASASFFVPLKETLPTADAISWQMAWQRCHLRLGIPISPPDTWFKALPMAFSVYWILGPREANG